MMSADSSIVALIVLVVLATTTESVEWNYEPESAYGPRRWNEAFPQYCDPSQNERQSPIDIKLGYTKYDSSLTPLEFNNFKSKDVRFDIHNSGHTVECRVLEGRMTTKGGPLLDDEYEVIQFHLHWGNQSHAGSEHTVLGKHYQAEMHIVHVNTKHNKLPWSEIIKKPDGVLVLSVFIDLATQENEMPANTEFSKLMRAAMDVQNKAETTKNLTLGQLQLDALLPGYPSYYHTYLGGMTTPTCDGATTWVVFYHPIFVRESELRVLYRVMNEENKPLTNNFRPVQEIGDRIVRSSYEYYNYNSGTPVLARTFQALITTLALIVVEVL